jgi:hypothetical protein
MPYGRPYPSGHGHHTPTCRWTPSLYPYATRKRRKRRAKPTARKPPASPGLGKSCLRLFGKAAVEMVNLLLDIVHQGGPTDRAIALLCDVAFAAVLFSSEISLALGLIVLGLRLSDVCEKEASNALIEDYREKTKAIRIQRKTSVNPPPTPEAIRRAWEASRTSLAGKLLAGTLLSDLEPVVDQSYLRAEDGTIVGRRPGIRGWLLANCPDMLPHYKALMNYKALADKLRKALGIEDPDTLAGVLDFAAMIPAVEEEPQAHAEPEGEKGTDTGEPSAGRQGGKTPDGGGMAPKSLALLKDFKLMYSNKVNVIGNADEIFGVSGEAGDGDEGARQWALPRSMAALDAVLRERLGLVWMRRVGKRPRAA